MIGVRIWAWITVVVIVIDRDIGIKRVVDSIGDRLREIVNERSKFCQLPFERNIIIFSSKLSILDPFFIIHSLTPLIKK